jgi:metal-sulfur cluster biosynthetic enzyme
MDGDKGCGAPGNGEEVSDRTEVLVEIVLIPEERLEMTAKVEDVTEAMKDVVDPELGINVVDLGLIYDVMVDESNIAVLNMTLTSAACPLQDVIEDQTRQALAPLTSDVKINWVWMPPWGPDKISDDGREQLRALGFTV